MDIGYQIVFDTFKEMLIAALIIQPLDWLLPFEIMYGSSADVIGVVLRQRRDKKS